MRTTVRLSDDLLRRAKRKALAEGRTLTAVLEEGLRLVLEKDRSAPKRKRVLPPVSKARGGFMPGIDPVKFFTQVEEEDDLDMLRRTGARK
jgi:hypothetical protein